jgi:hypothetical protein
VPKCKTRRSTTTNPPEREDLTRMPCHVASRSDDLRDFFYSLFEAYYSEWGDSEVRKTKSRFLFDHFAHGSVCLCKEGR